MRRYSAGDHDILAPRRIPAAPTLAPRPRARSVPRWAEPSPLFDREPYRDPFSDPFFSDPVDLGLPHSPAYDDLRAIIDRARRRLRRRSLRAGRRQL